VLPPAGVTVAVDDWPVTVAVLPGPVTAWAEVTGAVTTAVEVALTTDGGGTNTGGCPVMPSHSAR